MSRIHDYITDFTVDGKCSGCGSCCSGILPLSKDEVKRIKKYIKTHNIKEYRNKLLNGIDGTCPFRDETEKKCTIYEIRPDICKGFVCNQMMAEIQSRKIDFGKYRDIVYMREEFFGNPELREHLEAAVTTRRNNHDKDNNA